MVLEGGERGNRADAAVSPASTLSPRALRLISAAWTLSAAISVRRHAQKHKWAHFPPKRTDVGELTLPTV